jgi:hypothetical protein
MITFHVVYTAESTISLLPFAFSLLRSPAARFLFVDNGCDPDESRRLQSVADSEPRFSYYRLPFSEVVRHGLALDHLLERSTDPLFAILDSDVMATGDFLSELAERPSGCGAICSAWPIWIEDDEAVCAASQTFVGGPYRKLSDGTEVGGTGCAIYDRAALQTALRQIPAGLSNQTFHALGDGVRVSLAERGWNCIRFGTARVAHLQLVLQGNPIVNRHCAHLHHIGGVSHISDVAPHGLSAKLRRLASLLFRGDGSAASNLATNVKRRFSEDGREQAGTYMRKRKVVLHAGVTMEAIRRGDPPPATLPTGSSEVDARFALFLEALVRDYPAQCAQLSSVYRT